MEFDCHYPNSSNITVSQGYLQSLESRLIAMERRISPSNGGLSIEIPPAEPFTPTAPSLSGDIDIPVTVHDEQSPQGTDAMGSLGFVDEEETSYYGNSFQISSNYSQAGHSSNVPFISRVLKIVLPERESQLLASPPPPVPVKVNPYILPPKTQVLQLLLLYFTRCGRLFPYIDERGFYEDYNKAELGGFQHIKRSWLALLNIVFAMALQLDGSGIERDDRFRLADTFYQRARLLHQETRVNSLESSNNTFFLFVSM
jgi:hypothetical protein